MLLARIDLGYDVDILIDMDIIRHRDFVITNHRGTITFSFRILSMEEVDYVKEIKRIRI